MQNSTEFTFSSLDLIQYYFNIRFKCISSFLTFLDFLSDLLLSILGYFLSLFIIFFTFSETFFFSLWMSTVSLIPIWLVLYRSLPLFFQLWAFSLTLSTNLLHALFSLLCLFCFFLITFLCLLYFIYVVFLLSFFTYFKGFIFLDILLPQLTTPLIIAIWLANPWHWFNTTAMLLTHSLEDEDGSSWMYFTVLSWYWPIYSSVPTTTMCHIHSCHSI